MVLPKTTTGRMPQFLMSMLQYPLYDFLATVPSCPETSTLAMVLEIFAKQQCDRLVVVNQQQFPMGLLHSSRLAQKLLAATGQKKLLNFQQPLSTLKRTVVEPIRTIAATENLEKFSLYLRYQQNQKDSLPDWALTDAEGKFLGLIDNSRLLQFLAQEKIVIGTNTQPLAHDYDQKLPNPVRVRTKNERSPMLHKPLVQLLARLPWPLMLQTSNGEIVSQNPAWWQQLGVLKDPEGVRRQVETILAASTTKPEYPSQPLNKIPAQTRGVKGNEQSTSVKLQADLLLQEPPISTNSASSRCFLDGKLGTCTCIVEVQNGQERVWQFAKIPLDSTELKVLSAETQMTINTQRPPLNTNDLWLVLATDVTEQQQLCKELAAKNADLIQLNRLKDEFLACISHELKTPLTAVLGLSRLLVDQQLGELNERQARYAGLIHQSGRHLMSVVNDILDLTRMETGQMELTPTRVKIRSVCDRALAEVKTLYQQNNKATYGSKTPPENAINHQFSLVIEPGLDQMVADELRLRQMLVHLLSNAFKFTEASGEIGLKVSRWEGWIAFTIWDTGIGIPEHQQHLIFQKFQQLENPMTRQFEGTGLGLVLTRALARLHGGDVSFLSREGKGSQFTLLLPPSPPNTGLTEERETSNEEENSAGRTISTPPYQHFTTTPAHPTNYSSQRLILVVEAVARYIEDLTEHLKGLGYRVVIARSGTEALEKARRLQPKAIFLNPLLPLLSGWDVLTLLKADSATRHIPVIVTATAAEKEIAYANRADGFLSLPVEHAFLLALLEELFATVEVQQLGLENNNINSTKNPLRILRLVKSELEIMNSYPSLREHRVIEVDDLEQAEVLARVWQFDVVLLDVESAIAKIYLQQLPQHPQLAALPLVTFDVATTLAASKIPGLSVFPCLTPLNKEDSKFSGKIDPLLSVLQIASGVCYPPNILVVDLTMMPDLTQVKRKQPKIYLEANSVLNLESAKRGSEWFQALIQYLQTAGLKAEMGNSWAEVMQQLRHHSVDLLLICLSETVIQQEVQKAVTAIADLPLKLPPILVIGQTFNQEQQQNFESIETAVNAIATRILPRSISMEELLNQINQALVNGRR
ncbi:MAG TPA: ATP-binding protein [Nostocaceae cyanobacterium]|nr:ATP-binding protein [Nostocaceae cyanobacterium]